MVFESVVAEVLNRFLGDFVDNLDSSQLNIGIWGGDVRLSDLEVKETALDDLDLPIKLKFGYLSKLVLKIPWKNLYAEPVTADIEGFHLIVVPNKGVVYDERKAKKNEQDLKQKTLLRLEENRKNRRKPSSLQTDSFTEKLVAQVIKNLQVRIRSIHIRYEDKYTNRQRPFVAGISLEGLDFKTTDSDWNETIHKEAVQIVHKLVSLNSLAIYWNSNAELISDIADRGETKKKMHACIAVGTKRPSTYKYILDPITMQAKLAMNMKPETDGTNWKTPKIDLKICVDTLALCIGKLQYQDILLFLEAQERFNTATQYLKYRPNLNEYHGHSIEWWHFAYTSIIEENIRRKRRNWSWKRMKAHRELLKKYQIVWLRKQTEKSLSAEDTAIIEEAELNLDIFNLNIARQQAEMEIDRKGLVRLEDQPQGWMNWAKSWWGGGGEQRPESHQSHSDNIASKIEEAMTPEEKAKLFEAIDYEENTPPTDYPKHFIENVIEMELKSLMVVVENALSLRFSLLTAKVQQRPSARAINIVNRIRSLEMEGCGQPMVSLIKESDDWLSLVIDTNPLDRAANDYDQYIKLTIAPILVKYHAPAVNTAVDALRPPESVRLNQLTAAAMARYEDVKARSVTGLAHAVETKTKLVLDIRIGPATIVISEKGIFNSKHMTLLTDLGALTITTVEDKNKAARKSSNEVEKEERRRLLEAQVYDKFNVDLSDVQLILASNYDDAMAARKKKESALHILRPTGMNIEIDKCGIDDLQLAKIRIFGKLPDVVLAISDERLLMLLTLVLSIPTPPPEEIAAIESKLDEFEKPSLRERAKMRAIMEADEIGETAVAEVKHEEETEKSGADGQEKKDLHEQQVQLDMNLVLNQVAVVIGTRDETMMAVRIERLGCSLKMRTFDMVVLAHMGDLTIEQPQYKSMDPHRETLYLLDNILESGEHLLDLKFVQANPESPFFATEYNLTEQAIDITFKNLTVTLHQQALMGLKQFGESLQARVAEVQSTKQKEMSNITNGAEKAVRKLSRRLSQLSHASEKSTTGDTRKETESLVKQRAERLRRKELEKSDSDIVMKTRLDAVFGSMVLFIGSNNGVITSLNILDANASLKMRVKTVRLLASLRAITMHDCSPATCHKDLLSVCGEKKMFSLDFTQYNRTDSEKTRMSANDLDMSVVCRFAQMRFVFLNLWLARLLQWLGPFQQEAVKAAVQAQALATEKATEAAQHARQIIEQSPPRMHLDVELAAPQIIIPQKSTSLNAMVFDLGKLTIFNTFSSIEGQPKVIVDAIQIKLSDVNFGIGLLSGKEDPFIVSQCQILKPLSFSLDLYRNLCFDWYNDTPEILIDAHLPLIDVNMSQGDYATIMNTLNGNLAENVESAEEEAVDSASSTAMQESGTKPTVSRESRQATGLKQEATVDAGSTESSAIAKAVKRIVFAFKTDAICATLFSGSSNLERSVGIVQHNQSMVFAAVKILILKMSGSLMVDGALDVAISLDTFCMDDERGHGTKITRLLDKKADSMGRKSKEFVGIRYEQSSKNDKIINFSSSPFFLCLCPEFLGSLSSFFAVPQAIEDDASAIEGTTKAAAPIVPSKATKVSPSAPSGTLTMNCKLRETEVILVENADHPESTQALILSFNVDVEGSQEGEKKVMKGGLKNLQMVSTYYATEKRSYSHYQVLNKVDFSFTGVIDDKTRSQHFVVDIAPMHLKVSPSIIRLLSAVSASFSAANKPVEVSEATHKGMLKKYPNYWQIRKIDRAKYWWFDVAEEEDYCEPAIDVVAGLDHVEEAVIKLCSLIITLEAGKDDDTKPMILVESSFYGTASDWTSLLSMDAAMTLQVSYYNETFSVWEPVVEPVEVEDGLWQPWRLGMKLLSHGEDEEGEGGFPSPHQTISIQATDMLNVTVTKSFLQLLNRLSDSFAQAAKLISPPKSRTLPGSSPYLILNNTGVSVKVANSDTLRVSDSENDVIDATASTFVDLNVKFDRKEEIGLVQNQFAQKGELRLIFDDMNTEREVNVVRAEIRTVSLPRTAENGKQWKLVVETKIENSRRLVILRSPVQFINHTDIPYEIHSIRDTTLDLCGIVGPGSEPLDVPLALLYSPSGGLYIRPADDSFETSNESVIWYDFETKKRHILRCDLSANTKMGVYAALIIEEFTVKSEKHRSLTDRIFVVHIYPPVTLQNFLPFLVRIKSPLEKELAGGDEVALNVIPGHKIQFEMEYRGKAYFAEMPVGSENHDLEMVSLHCGDKEMNIGVHWSIEHRRLEAQLYAPYWFVNNTGMQLTYETGMSVTQDAFSEPVILPLDSSDFFQKKKAKVKTADSDWSSEFPLDAIGNAGRIICKAGMLEYEMTLNVQLCQSGLTKVISFSPFYLINNVSEFALEVKEYTADRWLKVEANKCIGFWPQQNQKRKMLIARYPGTTDESIMFPFTENFEGFCQVDNEYIGIYATCTLGESSSVIRLETFIPGMAPALIMNATKTPVEFGQKGAITRRRLEPWSYAHFTWTNVTHDRVMEWKCGNAAGSDGLFLNKFDSFKPSGDSGSVETYYWVSFLNGRQRVFLFTDDVAIMTMAHEAYEIERINQQCEISLKGLGLSLVDNYKTEEILYLGIASSSIIWEYESRNRYRLFTAKQIEAIEAAYQQWLVDHKEGWVIIEKIGINFETMQMKKKRTEMEIRRQYQTGLWMQYRQSPHSTQVHLKLNHLQVDNQLSSCVFPFVLCVVPPPKSVVQDNVPKPFTEFSFTMLQSEHSKIPQIKYLHLLVQEFAVSVDQGLLNALLELFASEDYNKPYTKENFNQDMELTKDQLSQLAVSTTASKQKAFYEDLHVSPLMIHLSFSLGGSSSDKGDKDAKHKPVAIQSEFVNVLLKSVGVTLTDLQDVVFKLAFFERKCVFYNQEQLQEEIISHYKMQAIKQLYVLVLGLDILGNPFGLVRDLSAGVEDFFYQPFQGAIQGPGEFAEGVALGVKSLFGATVGGATGAVSRITGTLGKGVAALTLDEDYQRKRQQAINRRPKNFGEGVALGAKNMGQGFYEGITGIVSKPIEGARTGGVGGFAAGLGKGLVGAVTRPVAGVVDFASTSLDAVRTASVGSDEKKALRPPRVVLPDNIVRPYCQKSALGAKLFKETDHGSMADTDSFVTYAPISQKCIFIVTDKRVVLSKRSDLVGSWSSEWQIPYMDMKTPEAVDKGIKLELRKKQKGFLGFGASNGKVIEFSSSAVAADVARKLLEAYEADVVGS